VWESFAHLTVVVSRWPKRPSGAQAVASPAFDNKVIGRGGQVSNAGERRGGGRCALAPVHCRPPFPNIDDGCSFWNKLQALPDRATEVLTPAEGDPAAAAAPRCRPEVTHCFLPFLSGSPSRQGGELLCGQPRHSGTGAGPPREEGEPSNRTKQLAADLVASCARRSSRKSPQKKPGQDTAQPPRCPALQRPVTGHGCLLHRPCGRAPLGTVVRHCRRAQ
jgi:hypothetical protein